MSLALFYSSVYINNLTTDAVNLTVSFQGTAIESSEWQLVEPTLAAFAPQNQAVVVSRDAGIHDGDSYTMLVNVNDSSGDLIVSAVIALTGTALGSDIAIGIQNSYVTNTGITASGLNTSTWTDSNNVNWAVEFQYAGLNTSGYHDVTYNFFQTVPGEAA